MIKKIGMINKKALRLARLFDVAYRLALKHPNIRHAQKQRTHLPKQG